MGEALINLVVAIAVLAFFAIAAIPTFLAEKRVKKKLETEGQVVPCYIVMANNVLWDGSLEGDNHAQVLFTLESNEETNLEDLFATMEAISQHLLNDFQADNNGDRDEKILAEAMKTGKVVVRPLLVPSRLTGQTQPFYSAAILVRRSWLPANKITSRWLYARVAVGKDGGTEMINYGLS